MMVPVPSPSLADMSIVDFLHMIRLESYSSAFEEQGWDDVPWLLTKSREELEQIANQVPMKPGHMRKFVDKVTAYASGNFTAAAPQLLALPGPATVSSSSSSLAKGATDLPGTAMAAADARTFCYTYMPSDPAPPVHLGTAYPVGSKRPAMELSTDEEAAIARQAAKAKARAEKLFNKQLQRAAQKASNSSSPKSDAMPLEIAAAREREAAQLKRRAEKAQAAEERQRWAEEARKQAAEQESLAAIERCYDAARPLSADGKLVLPGYANGVGEDLRKVGAVVWLTRDATVAEDYGRTDWEPADFRVEIIKISAQTFNAVRVRPGRHDVTAVPLSHCERVQLSQREVRAAEQGAKRDEYRLLQQLQLQRQREARLEALDGERLEQMEALQKEKEKQRARRSERERLALLVPSAPPPPLDGEEPECTALVVRASVNGGGRVKSTDLPSDLREDEEAVDVWSLAVEIKARKAEADRWVRGWRMKVIRRGAAGTGAQGYDMYIRAPDMRPEEMSNRHAGDSNTTIRSFVALERKLRERMESGASGGSCMTLLTATVYYDTVASRVKLELKPTVRAAPDKLQDGRANRYVHDADIATIG